MKKFCTLFTLVCAVSLTLSALPKSYAANGSAVATVQGGGISVAVSHLGMSNIKLGVNPDGRYTTTGLVEFTTHDNRGTAGGWSVSAALSDFSQRGVGDPTSGNSNISVKLNEVYTYLALVGGDGQYWPGGGDAQYYLSTTPETISVAEAGFGMGFASMTALQHTMILTSTATITEISGSGSKYALGDVIGIPAGIYEATLSTNINSGI
ncbi:hypothetical protein ACTHPH_21910 [Paenibacillus pasadenensis]|uniref:hypothetical protein n=1 Tax=Paenibacillus pasadenensis TaxID=217090 RepID=UPI000FD91059|nr:hypothetical protein [Paenibacillus pasadenensis]